MMNTIEAAQQLYKSLNDDHAKKPLEAGDSRYIPILSEQSGKDPIQKIHLRILMTESQSVNLLTGYRGNGKSTELRRLKALLEQAGCAVILLDMNDYIVQTKPIEISDFILSLMAALSEAVQQKHDLDPIRRNYWERLADFLQTEVQLKDLKIDLKTLGAGAQLGASLHRDHDFKQQIQHQLRGHTKGLVQDARTFVADIVSTFRTQNPDQKVVLLVDSLEQIRGVGNTHDSQQVLQSVTELFSGQASSLAFPLIHIVYTIPPYLSALAPNLGSSLGGHPLISWPNVHVRDRTGIPDPAGLEVMTNMISQRYPDWQRLISVEQLHQLAMAAGGDIRDYFLLISESMIILIMKKNHTLEADDLLYVANQLRNGMLPIARDDKQWLARIHASKDPELDNIDALSSLARFIDGNLIMNYQNGAPWYDIHPLLEEIIQA